MVASKRSRSIANKIVAAQSKLIRKGVRAGAKFGFRAQRRALAAYPNGDPAKVFVRELLKAVPTLSDGMIVAHMQGDRLVHGELRLAREFKTVFGKTKRALEKRLRLQESVIAKLATTYRSEALAVLEQTGLLAAANISEAMVAIQVEGLHVGAAKKRLRETFKKLGLTPTNSYSMENVFRTQINIGYSAGRWSANQDPAIDEILWGYEYVTVGDARVRPTHAGLDGSKYPKNHAFWKTNFPPNGYSCRCQAIELFEAPEGGTEAAPSTFTTEQDGKTVTVQPGADPGFRYNPGEVLAV